jgi:lipid-binding SYLF domain-containing protein
MHRVQVSVLASLLTLLTAGCTSWDPDAPAPDQIVEETKGKFLASDPDMSRFFDKAHGYAIFPSVGKGAFVIGGGYGGGWVVEQNEVIGKTSISEATVGLQIGGQAFSEVIFFKDAATLDAFKRGNFEFNSQVSVAVVTAGAAAKASYDKGMAVFVLPKGGLMAEASVGGQKFTYTPRPMEASARK